MGGSKLIEREYIVTLKAGVDYEQFNVEMIASTGAGAIPDRTVDVANARPGSKRNTHYALTEDEANTLRQDQRVDAVEIPPEQDDDIIIEPLAFQTGNFNKTTSSSGTYMNWGMRRCIERDNPYSASSTATLNTFGYNLDGTGVDVVIQDTGIQVGHPEFNDANGVSRIKQIDWYQESGLSGSMPSGHYSDWNGHGTHVAGTVAGLNYGWAKNAHIYSVRVNLSGDSSGFPVSGAFDIIKLWHRNKPIDPNTGYKRPTIVNMSWGSGTNFSSIEGGRYRGIDWTGTSKRTDYGMVGGGFFSRHPVRVASTDADVQELADEGIHVCIAAGNSRQKIDVPGGLDYNNWYRKSTSPRFIYYHRGGSPFGQHAMMIGNLDRIEHSSGFEQKNSSSECGPGVTVYAPGTNIMSAWTNASGQGGSTYHANSSYKQRNITGTSMASPQVCGLGACILQLEPYHTPASLKDKIRNLASQDKIYSSGLDDDYTNSRSLLDSANKLLYTPFSSGYPIKTS